MRGLGESVYDYDLIGRPMQISGTQMTTEFSYDDPASNTLGRVHKMTVSGSWNNEKNYSYNDQGLLEEVLTEVEGQSFNNRFEYDDFGRLERKYYPNGPTCFTFDPWGNPVLNIKRVGLWYHYNDHDYLSAISDLSNTLQYLSVGSMDGSGHLTELLSLIHI